MRWKRIVPAALLLGLACDQAVQHTVLADGVFLGRFVAPFDPPLFTDAQRDYVAAVRAAVEGGGGRPADALFDPELGWCPRPDTLALGARFDALGARAGARPHGPEPAPGARRAVAIGGSFTMGMEVADAEAWPARVEARAEALEVLNLGVAGYGLDQALMRWRRDGRGLGADEVWVGFMPEAVLRVSTQYAPAYHRWASMCAFKPRFAPDDAAPDGLRPIPSPARSQADALHLLTDQRAFFDALHGRDLWVTRTPAAFRPFGDSLLHRFAATRLALTAYEARGRDRAEWLADPESEVHRVLARILLALDRETRADGARLRVLVVPSRPDLARRVAEGRGYWEGFVGRMRADGIEVVDASDGLAALGGAGADALWEPHGHYTPLANEAVADVALAAWGR